MLTRCPNCETAFRVTPEQLKARQGQVRCGACQHVFNALESLVEEATIIHAPPQEIAVVNETDVSDEIIAPSEVPPSTEVVEAVQVNEDASPSPVVEPEEQAAALPEAAPTPALVPAPEPAFEPLLHELPTNPESPRLRWLWFGGASIAVIALAIQILLHFRVELAVLAPISRPALEALCSPFDCKVDLPNNVDLMTIESSDLQPDAEKKNILMLSATLRNRAPFAQAFPHLELSLTDAADKVIARRVLAPADYLDAGLTPEMPNTADSLIHKGLATGEFSLKLPIDGNQIAASGYRLYLFYP